MSDDFGPKPTFDWLPINRLSIDMRYQRSIEGDRSVKLIKRIAANFRWPKFGSILVSPGGMEIWSVIDGQHRLAAAKMAKITSVPCVIVDAPTVEQQADTFVAANKDRVQITAVAVYHAKVAAGDVRANKIAHVCAEAGVTIPRYPKPHRLLKPSESAGADTIGVLIDLHGETHAINTLLTMRAAYHSTPGVLRSHLIRGMSMFLKAHPGVERRAVANLMEKVSLDRMEQTIAMRAIQDKIAKPLAFQRTIEAAQQFGAQALIVGAAPPTTMRERPNLRVMVE